MAPLQATQIQLIQGQLCAATHINLRAADIERLSFAPAYSCPNGCTAVIGESYICPGGSGGLYLWDGDAVGGGGTGTGSECPSENPECLLPLREQDITKIATALTTVDMSRPICRDAAIKVNELMGTTPKMIFRGNPFIPNSPGDRHFGQAFILNGQPGFHINQDFPQSGSSASLAAILIHEAWHTLQYPDHPNSETYPYSTFPYSEQASCANQSAQ